MSVVSTGPDDTAALARRTGSPTFATLPAVANRRLTWLVVGASIAAVWGAARYAGCLTALAVAVLLATLALRPEERRLISPGWAVGGVLVLAIAWTVALDHELAFRQTLIIVLAAALFALARRARPDDGAVAVLALGIAATVAVAVAQVTGGLEHAQAAVSSIAPELREHAAQRLAIGRASGTAALPGHFAALLVMAAPLLWGRLARERGWRRAAWGMALLACATGVVMSRSLAAVLVAAAVAAAAIAARRPRWQLLAAGGAVLAALAVATLLLRTDLGRLEPVRLRWINWQTTAWVLVQHPLLGVGLGGIGQAGLLAPTGAANITPYAHNSYLQLAAELGLAGAGLLVAGVVALVRLLRAGRHEHLPLALAVAVLPLHNVFDFSAYAPEVVLPWAVLAGALAARVARPPERPLPSWLLVPVLGGAVILSAAAWRSEVLLGVAYASPPQPAVTAAQQAARWAPWSLRPVLAAASAALATGDARVAAIDGELARRAWVLPVSAAWAEMRARLLLAAGQRGEALAWAREARRRAPWRGELGILEASCRGAS